MRRSFLLGLLGGICSFLAGISAFFVMVIGQASRAVETDLTVNVDLAFLAGILGIVGRCITRDSF